MSAPHPRIRCAICEWADDHTPLQANAATFNKPIAAQYRVHFSTAAHKANYKRWCQYRDEQNFPNDYVEEWLDQFSLKDLHASVCIDNNYSSWSAQAPVSLSPGLRLA